MRRIPIAVSVLAVWLGGNPVAFAADLAQTHANDPSARAAAQLDRASCTFDGHALYGRIKAVDALADVKVKVVTAFPDLRVRAVSALATHCGEWQIVDGIADTTIQFVDAFPDVTIQFVDAFPGIP